MLDIRFRYHATRRALFLLPAAIIVATSVSVVVADVRGQCQHEDGSSSSLGECASTESEHIRPPHRSVIDDGRILPAAFDLRAEGDAQLGEGRHDDAAASYRGAVDILLASSSSSSSLLSLAWPNKEEFASEALASSARAHLAAGRPERSLEECRDALALPFARTQPGTKGRFEILTTAVEALAALEEEAESGGGEGGGGEGESRLEEARALIFEAESMGSYLPPTFEGGAEIKARLLDSAKRLKYANLPSFPAVDVIVEASEMIGDEIMAFIQDANRIEDFDTASSRMRSSVQSSRFHLGSPSRDGRHALYGAALAYLLFTMENGAEFSAQSSPAPSRPLQAFNLTLVALLESGAHVDQRSAGKGAARRPPLHLAARSGSPLAVQAMLDVGADVNLRDDEGWTALMAACMVDRNRAVPPSEAAGRLESARLLLDAGARCDDSNYEGKTALHIAAESMQPPLVELLLDGGADMSLRTAYGQTPLGIVYQNAWADESAARRSAEVIRAHPSMAAIDHQHNLFMKEEMKAARFMSFLHDSLGGAANEISGDADEQERHIVTALMSFVGINPDLIGRPLTNESGNWYGELHSRVASLIPDAYWKIYRSDSELTEDDFDLMAGIDGAAAEAAEVVADEETGIRSIDAYLLRTELFGSFRERGYYARLMDSFTMLGVNPIQHSVAFAVPSDDVLRGIGKHGPLVEVGAGTGYWAAALRVVAGADIVAYDPFPPADAKNAHFQRWTYGQVDQGECASLFGGDGGPDLARSRSLLIVWPNNADVQDNAHLDKADTGLPVWDSGCLEAYLGAGGTTVVYVGERKEAIQLTDGATAPDWGFTSSRRFQEMLLEEMELVERMECPKWFLNEDDVTVWRKKVL